THRGRLYLGGLCERRLPGGDTGHRVAAGADSPVHPGAEAGQADGLMDRAELEGAVQALLAERGRVLLALEGMSAAGKTTLAAELAQAYGGNVYHMDDFCFPAHQRPDDW